MRLTLVVLSLVLVFSLTTVAASKKRLSFGTGGTAGVWFPLGAGMADILNRKCEGVIVTAEVTSGSVENTRLVGEGTIPMGFANDDAAYFAYHGTGIFNKKLDVYSMFRVYPSCMQVVVLESSGIKSIKDLKGKRVCVGSPASSAELMGWNILDAYGIKKSDIRPAVLSFAESADALKDGNIDATFIMTGAPNSAVMDIMASKQAKVLPIDQNIIEKLTKDYGYYSSWVIPAGTYKGQDAPVATIGLMTTLIANSKLDEETAYNITKTIFENLDEVRKIHSVMAGYTAEEAVKVPIPMHPGAKRYFKEKGLVK